MHLIRNNLRLAYMKLYYVAIMLVVYYTWQLHQLDKEVKYWKNSYWSLSKRYSEFLDRSKKLSEKRLQDILDPKDKHGVRESDKYGI